MTGCAFLDDYCMPAMMFSRRKVSLHKNKNHPPGAGWWEGLIAVITKFIWKLK